MKNRDLELTWIDYVVSAIGSVAVLVSAGIGVRNEQAGYVFCAIALLGHLFSAFGPRLKWSWNRLTIDGVLFAGCAFASLAFAGELNRFLPEGGFPPQLLYTAGLCWVISLGSFLAWRDSTLLFLGVPAIALFGLVGAFDTFQFAPLMFFAFLVATGVLFARSHLRGMLKLAAMAGEPDLYRLRRYAWKSLAGPEWALISAVGVIAFSALGAPFIRSTVQDATSPLRVPLRAATSSVSSAVASNGFGRPDSNRQNIRVGNGPFGRPSENPVLIAEMDEPHYLRGEAFYRFQDNRWTTFELGGRFVQRGETRAYDLGRINPESIELNGKGIPFSYRLTSSTSSLPGPYLPGVLDQLEGGNPRSLVLRSDGILILVRDGAMGPMVSGRSYDPDPSHLKRAVRPSFWRASFDQVEVTQRVRKAIDEAIANKTTDYDKAEALRRMVSRRITYNLQAAMIPDGKDVVDTALFETKEGYCDIFATCLAVVAREAGLPARVASGYLVTDANETRPGQYRVRESDYHIWTEIYFENAGWVTFDATEGAAEVDGFGRGAPWQAVPAWYEESWARHTGNVLMVACIIGLASVLLWDIAKRLIARIRPDGSQIVAKHAEWESMVAGVLEGLEKASGLPRRFSETSAEYCQRLASRYPEANLNATIISDALDRLLFAPANSDMAESVQSLNDERSKFSVLRQTRKAR